MPTFERGDVVVYQPTLDRDRHAPAYLGSLGIISNEPTKSGIRPHEGEVTVHWLLCSAPRHDPVTLHYAENLQKIGHVDDF